MTDFGLDDWVSIPDKASVSPVPYHVQTSSGAESSSEAAGVFCIEKRQAKGVERSSLELSYRIITWF
jgi:hypothetical protein